PHTVTYSTSLHDALPISRGFTCFRIPLNTSYTVVDIISINPESLESQRIQSCVRAGRKHNGIFRSSLVEFLASWISLFIQSSDKDRKSTRLNSSHVKISY